MQQKQLSLLLIIGREIEKFPVGTPRIEQYASFDYSPTVIQFLTDTGTFYHLSYLQNKLLPRSRVSVFVIAVNVS